MNNLYLVELTGDETWQPLSDDSQTLSGVLVAKAANAELRFDGGSGVTLIANVPFSFTQIDLSRVEFYGTALVKLLVFAGSW